jgi:hypothetical protein
VSELHLKARSHSKNAPNTVQARQHLRRLTGVDLVAVDGFSESLAQSLIAEIGTDTPALALRASAVQV